MPRMIAAAPSKRLRPVDRLAAASGAAKTPALILAAHPLPLSTREPEIANLAAQGRPNRAIAERLVLSARTVKSHIYRACIKLDVRARDIWRDAPHGQEREHVGTRLRVGVHLGTARIDEAGSPT
jgi:ATP/maltotriose-dependent transcriptional regulator MalT